MDQEFSNGVATRLNGTLVQNGFRFWAELTIRVNWWESGQGNRVLIELLLQTRHMEHQVKPSGLREVQFVSNRPNALKNLERAKEPRGKFQILPRSQGLMAVRLQTQVHSITHLKYPLCYVFISLNLHSVVSFVEIFFEETNSSAAIFKKIIHS
jgi:hypothetical protein